MSERLDKLRELAGLVDPQYAIVELGVSRGESIAELARGSNGAPVFGIDLWHWVTDNSKQAKHRKRRGFQNKNAKSEAVYALAKDNLKATLIQGDTREVSKAWSRPIGLLYIDAAHDIVSVAHDYEDWARWIVPGGWIAFDDAQPGEKVNKVIQTIVEVSGCWDNWDRVDENGRLAFAQRNSAANPILKPAAQCGGDYEY